MTDAARVLGWRALLGILCVVLFAIRLSGPTDVEGNAQQRNVGYVMDAVWGGHWLVQHDIEGRILSKPPAHTWLAAFPALFLGLDRLTLTLPSFLGVLGLSGLVLEVGRRRFGLLAAGCAGLALLLAPMSVKQIALVRSDALFALAVAGSAFAAWHAWESGRGWLWFWLAAGVATLIKGPLGLLLAAGGLLAWFWERRGGHSPPSLRGPHGLGLWLYLLLPLAWFLPAWWQAGQPLIDKLFLDELIGHAVGKGEARGMGENLLRPIAFFLGRFAPFSLFAAYALWRLWRYPAQADTERRFERFLACWVLAGLAVFSLAAHHRADLLLPLWAPAALLAGREMARLLGWGSRRWGARPTYVLFALLHAGMLAFAYVNFHHPSGSREANVRYTERVRAAAMALQASGIDPERLLHVDTPVSLQLYWRTHRYWLQEAELAALRKATPGHAFLLAFEKSRPADLGFVVPAFQVEALFSDASGTAQPVLSVYRVTPVSVMD